MIVRPPKTLAQGYYSKAIEWQGVHVVGHKSVPDVALYVAAETVFNLLRHRPDIVTRMAEGNARYAVAPEGGVAVDLPEFAFLKGVDTFDGRDYGTVIGLGGTIGLPVSSSNVDNVLGLPSDPYLGLQNILLHEAAHMIKNVGFDAALLEELRAAFENAKTLAVWDGTYGISNEDEYFAELSEAYFGHDRAADGTKNHINTRAELKADDPLAFALLRKVYGDDAWNDGDWVLRDASGKITGLATPDFMVGGNGNDTIKGGRGDDLAFGGAGDDILVGGNQHDTLIGGDGKDSLNGGKGRDILDGGLGNDLLKGGGGADTFVFGSFKESSRKKPDQIVDFRPAQNDRIDLKAIDSKSGTKKNNAFTFIDTEKFSKLKGELRAVTKKGDTFVYGDINGDGKADLSIVLRGEVDLDASHFLL